MELNDIWDLVNQDDDEIKNLWMGWDKGDCSIVGLLRILMIQEIRRHIRENGIHYDGMYDDMLTALYDKYQT